MRQDLLNKQNKSVTTRQVVSRHRALVPAELGAIEVPNCIGSYRIVSQGLCIAVAFGKVDVSVLIWGTGMIASSSTFCPHQGRVIRNLFRQLHAVWHGTEALVYSN